MTLCERYDDYVKSCEYGTAKMREARVKRGELMPCADNPEEMAWHRGWLEASLAEVTGQRVAS